MYLCQHFIFSHGRCCSKWWHAVFLSSTLIFHFCMGCLVTNTNPGLTILQTVLFFNAVSFFLKLFFYRVLHLICFNTQSTGCYLKSNDLFFKLTSEFSVFTGPRWVDAHSSSLGSALCCGGQQWRQYARHFQYNAQGHYFWTQDSSVRPQLSDMHR